MSWNEKARISCRFRFKCPQVWDRLQPTDVEGVRHCPECRRDVHLASTEEDFRRHSNEGHCIAVPVLRVEEAQGQDDSMAYLVGNAFPPYDGH